MGNRLIVSVVLLSSASLNSMLAQGHASRHKGGHHSHHQHPTGHGAGHSGHCHHKSNHTNTQYGYMSPTRGVPNVVKTIPVPQLQSPIIVLSVPIIF